MSEEFRVCAGCGRPLGDDDEFVTAEPLIRMHAVGDTSVVVAGAPLPFHPQHVPAGAGWRVLTA